MGDSTGIAWCHRTFNPWEGCAKVSAGCKRCYAEARNERFHEGANWGADAPRLMRSPAYWNSPRRWNREAAIPRRPLRVFSGSLCDVAEDRPDLAHPRGRLILEIGRCTMLNWLLVSKRPENYLRLFGEAMSLPNVWAGATVEERATLGRIDALRAVPAPIRFLSIEPLVEDLGVIDLRGIHWIILGGESGHGARPFDLSWARDLAAQGRAAGCAVFWKQLGAFCRQGSTGHRLSLNDSHGADPGEWPSWLPWVREFPDEMPAADSRDPDSPRFPF